MLNDHCSIRFCNLFITSIIDLNDSYPSASYKDLTQNLTQASNVYNVVSRLLQVTNYNAIQLHAIIAIVFLLSIGIHKQIYIIDFAFISLEY